MAAIEFDADEVAPSTGFDAIPAGKYKVVIVESEEKPTKNKDGSYLQFTFQIIEGECENRKLFARLNLNNKSDQAVGIARSELSAICHAVDKKKIRESSQLHDIPLFVRVSCAADDKNVMRNEIKGYESVGGSTAAKLASKEADKTPPWKKAK